jgi:hypothetical protein
MRESCCRRPADAAVAASQAFIVSCSLQGYVGPEDEVVAASLVVMRSSSNGINPLSDRWVTPKYGRAPARLLTAAVSHPSHCCG